MALFFSKATQPIRMQGQKKSYYLQEKKDAHPMMQDFQT